MRKIALILCTVAVLILGAAAPAFAVGSDFGCATASAATANGAPFSAPGTAAVAAHCPSVP
jgi:hypothetical protein